MKRCALQDKNYNCHRETTCCEFSWDCLGDYTKEKVEILRQDAINAYQELKKARSNYIAKSKAFGLGEQRLTEKKSEWHLVEVVEPWWKFWRPK